MATLIKSIFMIFFTSSVLLGAAQTLGISKIALLPLTRAEIEGISLIWVWVERKNGSRGLGIMPKLSYGKFGLGQGGLSGLLPGGIWEASGPRGSPGAPEAPGREKMQHLSAKMQKFKKNIKKPMFFEVQSHEILLQQTTCHLRQQRISHFAPANLVLIIMMRDIS